MQSIEIVIEDRDFVGMPFVLHSGGKWLKNNGADFYIQFAAESRKAKKVIVRFKLLPCSIMVLSLFLFSDMPIFFFGFLGG